LEQLAVGRRGNVQVAKKRRARSAAARRRSAAAPWRKNKSSSISSSAAFALGTGVEAEDLDDLLDSSVGDFHVDWEVRKKTLGIPLQLKGMSATHARVASLRFFFSVAFSAIF
jgi:hypothetical protein